MRRKTFLKENETIGEDSDDESEAEFDIPEDDNE